jgi:serine/threonine protein kinase
MHDQGYIHRDVKPENMLLTVDDCILLCDLGIAIPIRDGEKRVNSMGTPSYVAPEQIEGYPSHKSDQYSLAIVAYELFCGIRPFTGSLSHLLWRQMLFPTAISHTRWKKIPLAAEQVIKKALAPDPDRRFSRIETFARELGGALCSPSVLLGETEEIEYVRKTPETRDCEQQHIHTPPPSLDYPNTTHLN